MEIDHFVEEGFLTKTSLNSLIHHAMENCPKLERIVGEWTKIPDRFSFISCLSEWGLGYFYEVDCPVSWQMGILFELLDIDIVY